MLFCFPQKSFVWFWEIGREKRYLFCVCWKRVSKWHSFNSLGGIGNLSFLSLSFGELEPRKMVRHWFRRSKFELHAWNSKKSNQIDQTIFPFLLKIIKWVNHHASYWFLMKTTVNAPGIKFSGHGQNKKKTAKQTNQHWQRHQTQPACLTKSKQSARICDTLIESIFYFISFAFDLNNNEHKKIKSPDT